MNENAKIRVLIAEDDPIQNDLLKDALELESDMACCGQACDGLEALAKLQTEQPDVLLLDIVMPNMDGVDLLNELRENPPPKRPKVIAISAYGQEHIARAALAQGADWFLLKPYQLELLMRRIRTLAGEAPSQKKCTLEHCALPGFVDSKNEEKTERNAGYLVVSHSGGGMLRQGTRKGIRRTPANRGMRAHRIVKSLDISEDVCHGLCP